MSTERIDKILSHAGFGSRKNIRRLLRTSEVTVGGGRVADPAFHADPDRDEIAVDGRPVQVFRNIYLMMNKTAGAVSARRDGLHRTVFDFLPAEYRTPYIASRLHITGRLDIDTEGLLLFTTDGTLTHRITSPVTHLPKKYLVRLAAPESPERQNLIRAEFAAGIRIAAEDAAPAAVCAPAEIVWNAPDEAVLTITEGKYHQIKRMFAAAGNAVAYLKRLAIGPLALDSSLRPGEFRHLTAAEVGQLVT